MPHPQQDLRDASYFQGFTPGIIDTAPIIQKILTLPASYLELLIPRQESLYRRIHGFGYSILPIDCRLLEQMPSSAERPFMCVFSYDETYEQIVSFTTRSERPILHVSTVDSADAIPFSRLSRGHIDTYCARLVSQLYAQHETDELRWWVLANKRNRVRWKRTIRGVTARHHNSTLPNELALQSAGYILSSGSTLVSNSDLTYVESILRSYDKIVIERGSVLSQGSRFPYYLPSSTDIVLSSPSIYRHLYFDKSLWRELRRDLSKRALQLVRKFVLQQRHYYVDIHEEELRELRESQAAQQLVQIRQSELATHTLASSAVACSSLSPVLRLPNGVNLVYSDLKQLADCARGNSPHKRFKTSKLARRIVDRLHGAIPAEFIQRLSGPTKTVKVLADVPLEWLRVDGMPLALRHDVVRVPTTPGNLFFGEALLNSDRFVSFEELKTILVIRSFVEDDPIKRCLEHAIMAEGKEFVGDLDVRIVDVDSERALIDALEAFDGAIMIYDGHGATKGHYDIAGLMIGGEVVDVWNLRGKARVPPVVLLSACDTHPIDGSHASTANGFIAAGALTVLGTMLPVRAVDSAIFIARFLYRLSAYVPIVLNHNGAIRWSSLFAGMQRMAFVTEALHSIFENYGISIEEEVYKKIHFEMNMEINTGRDDWYEYLYEVVSTNIRVDADEVRALIEKDLFLPECLKYTQLGNAERVVLVRSEAPIQATPNQQASPA